MQMSYCRNDGQKNERQKNFHPRFAFSFLCPPVFLPPSTYGSFIDIEIGPAKPFVMAEPTFDHERLDVDRLCIEYLAYSFEASQSRGGEAVVSNALEGVPLIERPQLLWPR
jgi:hypothetical protein